VPEIHSLESVRNFRDFGGYQLGAGGQINSGKLFRCAHFNETNEADQKFLKDLALSLIVDLRHKPERVRQPSRYPSADDVLTFTLIEPEEAPEYAPHEMFLKEQLETADDARNYMIRSYGARPVNPAFVEIFARTLNHMAKQGGPLAIHCAAGKDRTGTLVAIIHKILGLNDDDIMEDYMLTMKAVDIESFLEPAAKFMSERFDRPIKPDALRPMFGVEPAFLKAALKSIGDFDEYPEQVLGMNPDTLTKIRKNYST